MTLIKDSYTQEEKVAIVAELKHLLTNPTYLAVKELHLKNAEIAKDQLLSGHGIETKEDVDRVRDRYKLLIEVGNAVETMMSRFETVEKPIVPDDDPY